MAKQMQIPFTPALRACVMIETLWAAVPGPTDDERFQQIEQALLLTSKANPRVKGEGLFLLTVDWLKTSRVVA
jgi:hypothetical protein